LQDFFGTVNRSRVTRCLKPLFGYATARDFAHESTVRHPADGRVILPYGFVQSPIIASLCLAESAVGVFLQTLHADVTFTVSVYMDDITISSDTADETKWALERLCASIDRSRFKVSADKVQGPAQLVTAFNIELSIGALRVESVRLKQFSVAMASSSSHLQREGIRGYVSSVDPGQAHVL